MYGNFQNIQRNTHIPIIMTPHLPPPPHLQHNKNDKKNSNKTMNDLHTKWTTLTKINANRNKAHFVASSIEYPNK